ncbi:hypothetical protein I79_025575 [Cricetulus griseus]|uniref:Uncharacterized protein n=1 Tax=Cricetulus griseus TaxID=10029 RepID=G3INP4_CRIGR|nr:hypothetical protein I79_025575 [Cricetulus griseus]
MGWKEAQALPPCFPCGGGGVILACYSVMNHTSPSLTGVKAGAWSQLCLLFHTASPLTKELTLLPREYKQEPWRILVAGS